MVTCCCVETPRSILDNEGRDVFEEIIIGGEHYRLEKMAALWHEYRQHGIGSCDIDYWIECMRARYFSIAEKYDIAWEMWEKFRNDGNKSFADSSAHSVTVNEHEDNPDNPQSGIRFLSSRDTVTHDGETFGGLGSTTAAQYLEDIPNLPRDFAREFKELFYWGM